MEQIAYLKSNKYSRKWNNQVQDLLKSNGIEYSLVSTKWGKRVLVKSEDMPKAAKLVLSVKLS